MIINRVFGIQFYALIIWVGLSINLFGIAFQGGEAGFLFLFLSFMIMMVNKYHPRVELPSKKGLYIIVSLLLLSIFSFTSLFKSDLEDIFKFFIQYLSGACVVFMIFNIVKNNKNFNDTINYIIYGAVLSSLIVLLGYFIGSIGDITIGRSGRSQALLRNPNQFAMMLSSVMPLASVRLLDRNKAVDLILFAFLIFGIIATGSKANIIISLCAVGAIYYVNAVIKNRNVLIITAKLFSLTLMLLMLIIVGLNLLQEINPRTLRELTILFSEDFESVRAIKTREDTWKDVINLVNNSFWGLGLGNEMKYLGWPHAHNVFFQFYFVMGYSGLILISNIILSIILYGYEIIKKYISECNDAILTLKVVAIFLGLLSYIAANQTSDSFGNTTIPIFWVLLGIFISTEKFFYDD